MTLLNGLSPIAPQVWKVDAINAGRRLDALLKRLYKPLPYHLLQRALRQGWIRLNGKRVAGEKRLEVGDVVELQTVFLKQQEQFSSHTSEASGHVKATSLTPEQKQRAHRFSQSILYEDETLMVVNKPSGLPVHAGSAHLRDHLLYDAECYLGNRPRALGYELGIAQRLDKDVTGVVLIGKRADILKQLQKQVDKQIMAKTYIAWVYGVFCWPEDVRLIDLPLVSRRYGIHGIKKSFIDPQGQKALTRCTLAKHLRSPSIQRSCLQVTLEHGRLHQIRCHLQAVGHSIVGDKLYGQEDGLPLYLHAEILDFIHPLSNKAMRCQAPMPDFWHAFLVS